MVTIDSYSETNQSAQWNIRGIHPSAGNISAAGQSFTVSGASYYLTEAVFYLKKAAVPDATAVAVLYAHSGTYGTNSVPTGAALATSNGYAVSGLTGAYQLITFTFPEPYYLMTAGQYCIDIEISAAVLIDNTNYVIFGADSTGPTHGGNCFRYTSGAWASNAYDGCFYVNGNILETESGVWVQGERRPSQARTRHDDRVKKKKLLSILQMYLRSKVGKT